MSYEGMREGIRDDKYLTTLDKLVKSSKPSSPEEVAKVNSAKAYLENIKQKNSKLEWYKDFFWKLRPNGFYELILGAVSTKGEDDFEYFSDIRDKIASYIVDIKNVTVDLTPVAKSSSNGARGPSNGDTYVIPSSASGPYFDDMRANPNGSVLSSTTISTLATKSLKLNDKGDGVKSLKTFFRSRNYLESSNQSDVYDDKTIEAVKAFQKRFDIKGDVSGEVGSNTIQVLKTISAEIIKEPMSFVVPVIFGDKGKEVLKVKKVLVREGFLKKEDTGNELFDDKMLLAVKDFQIHYGLAKEGSPGFGSIGPNTRIVLNVLSRATLSGVVNKSYKISKTLYKGMRDNEVATLQEFLVDNKYMNLNTITNYFGSITHNALVKFQIDKKIISSPNDPGAGVVGPKTRGKINNQ
jgi:peptidoglycan hydrolase-like protein with peptidoglycan-binding domain